ncbi:General transcription factor IIH subunit 2 [Mitosporidium daphniae]
MSTKAGQTQWESAAAKMLSTILGTTNEEGSSDSFIEGISQNPFKVASTAKRGIIRHLCIILDTSEPSNDKEWRPSKLFAISDLLKKRFFQLFFESNPIGQLSIVATFNGTATVLVPPTCDLDLLVEKFNTSVIDDGTGSASLENALRLSVALFQASKEILFLFNALSSVDPGDINSAIDMSRKAGVSISMIHTNAALFVAQRMCNLTNGSFAVALDYFNFKELLETFAEPRPLYSATNSKSVQLVKMGFPQQSINPVDICTCHSRRLESSGYSCPRCVAIVCFIPSDCPVCKLTLISSSHIGRSLHHLFPLKDFDEVAAGGPCFCCNLSNGQLFFQCPNCKCCYCKECNGFLHSQLYTCPGCNVADQN